nr:PREDICTED: uncharacterized protein LOC105671825 [Linepithema humile]
MIFRDSCHKSAITSINLRGGAGPGGVRRQRSNYRININYNSAVSHHVQMNLRATISAIVDNIRFRRKIVPSYNSIIECIGSAVICRECRDSFARVRNAVI